MARKAVITGTTHGIGTVTARELARAGWDVVMLVRDAAAGERLRARLQAQSPDVRVTVQHCDLASMASVRQAAAALFESGIAIDALIHNAGIVAMSRQLSEDGFERVFATNHLGPFLLTSLLLPCMAANGRIVHVASKAHVGATLDLGQVVGPLPPSVRWRPTQAYAQSKLANILHCFALARRLGADERARLMSANCLHPGVIRSNLLPGWVRVLKPLVSRGMIDVEAGAVASLRLATDPALAGVSGVYFDEVGRPCKASSMAHDIGLQEALWAASERWVAAS